MLKSRIGIIFSAMSMSLLMGSGCTSYRMNCPPPDQNKRHWEASESMSSHGVCVVEFDDMGEFWDIRQLWAAVDYLKKVHEENPQGVITLMFVHGWHQQAHWEDGRLVWFEKQIKELAEAASTRAEREGESKPQPVVGIYMAWRGQLNTIPLVKQTTYWNRIIAAQRIASVDFTEALITLLEAGDGNSEISKCILMAHSMGATILEYVITPYLTAQLLGGGPAMDVSSALDLVMLINPSVEARYTLQLIDLMKRRHVRLYEVNEENEMKPAQGPLLVTFSAEDDVITRVSFPLGQFVTSLFLKFRDYTEPSLPGQYELNLKTAGHMPFLVSHRVDMEQNGQFRLIPSTNTYNDTPFWIVGVSKEIMGDHSDIDNVNFQHLVEYFLELNDTFNPDTSLRITQDPAVGRQRIESFFDIPDADIYAPVPR